MFFFENIYGATYRRFANSIYYKGSKDLAYALQSCNFDSFTVDLHPCSRIIIMFFFTKIGIGENLFVGSNYNIFNNFILDGTEK